MEVIREKQAMRDWTRAQRKAGERIAFIPTMGYLHEGHLSLVREAKLHATKVVVSVYVNSAQFAPGEDLSTYPRDFEGDLKRLKPLDVNVVFNPFDLYNRDSSTENFSGHETWIRVERLEKPLCGNDRPIFFRGVATIVAKLFNIIEPDVAIFGKKDYQQWRVIRRMVRDLDFAVEIIGCPISREEDGLAMSSRNVRLSATDRQNSLSISRSLREAEEAVKSGETDARVLEELVLKAITSAGGSVDYAKIVDQETLQEVKTVEFPVVFAVAARFGSVRLLDNMELQPPSLPPSNPVSPQPTPGPKLGHEIVFF
uniref:Pantoate--beta-alanine ligase n=1 Tax=Physcomitrium patens TaxID=3218 RepID=Q2P9M3_PHYPA|nr:putative pantoate-beta-alanine ligase [Physcomitrium patens]